MEDDEQREAVLAVMFGGLEEEDSQTHGVELAEAYKASLLCGLKSLVGCTGQPVDVVCVTLALF